MSRTPAPSRAEGHLLLELPYSKEITNPKNPYDFIFFSDTLQEKRQHAQAISNNNKTPLEMPYERF
jgi:hypothetical protein